MKKVNWKVIPPQKLSKDSIWAQHGTELPSKDLCDGLVANFSAKPTVKMNKIFATKPTIGLRVIDSHRATCLLVLLRVQYKTTSYEEIKQFILWCEESKLSVDFIDGLIKCLPQPYQVYNINLLTPPSTILEIITCDVV